MRVEQLSREEYSDALPSSGFEVFHTPDALGALDRHTDAELRLYGGFKGDRPVALWPTFVNERPVGTTITSPPPGMGVPRLGPLTMPASPKRRKQEKVNREFTSEVLSDLGADGRGTAFRAICGANYPDPRPFVWDEFSVTPGFTYVLDLEDADTEEVKRSFSKSLRREIRDAEDLDVAVTVEGVDGAREVYETTRERYEEQDRTLSPEWPYVEDLVESLDDRARVYVARDDDGEFLGGITALYSNDHAYFWQGGTRAVHDGVSVNGLLHWHIVSDLVTESPNGATGYDLMGANTERLCQYKAKFGADLQPYWTVETDGAGMGALKTAYRMVNR
ncbi:GNAT family N-acetyltransferase [Halobacterium zhouii]|uniref:GNAT family N-acetyltransferase n=1 Tax=Halobacterium zhouii TaxID=2902624 RepID=UPI001E49D5EB|nr:GNAT family N-acetyltransferase [Halobacterium zhouii]